MTTWFTSDHHFFHKNIIQHCNRPFKDLEEMHDRFIEAWNAFVRNGDLVYYLGDFAFSNNVDDVEKILKRLNGNISLVKGNHDTKFEQLLRKCSTKIQNKFIKIRDYHTTKETAFGTEYYLVLMHFPIEIWDRKHYGSIMLHGHIHNRNSNLNMGLNRYNVGVDVNWWKPVEIHHIVTAIQQCRNP